MNTTESSVGQLTVVLTRTDRSPDQTCADTCARLEDALARVRTPYTALAVNDDVIATATARDAVRFLEGHPDYASCGGQISLDDDAARERLRRLSQHAEHLTDYHVQRTAEVQDRLRVARAANLTDLVLFEQLLAFLTAIAGKVRALEIGRGARHSDSPPRVDTFGRMLSPTWSRDFTTALEVASAALAAQDRIPVQEARHHMLAAYRMETAPALLADLIDEPTVTLSMTITAGIAQRLLRLSPDNRFRRAMRAVYRRTRWISVDAVHGTQIRGRRVKDAERAFQPIRDFLTSPPPL